MSTELHDQPAPLCPRCGYDQSGVVAAWERQCPVRGVCSECGARFPWRHVLGRRVAGPGWSIEHGERLRARRIARAMLAGGAMPRVWSRLEYSSPVDRARLLVLVLASLLVTHLVLAVLVVASETVTMWVQTGGLGLDGWRNGLTNPYSRAVQVPIPGATSGVAVWSVLVLNVMLVVAPAALLLNLAQSMSRVGVRRVHVLRGIAYSAPLVVTGTVLMLALLVCAVLVREHGPAWLGPLAPTIEWSAALGWPVVHFVRWRSFVSAYLGLPHGTGVALSMVVIACLATLASFALPSVFG